jgi:trigger factor
MQVTETLNEGLKRKLAVVIPASDLNQRLDTRLGELKDTANIKGFRPGKVPMTHLKKVYGRSAMSEVMSDAINATVGKALDERSERAATQPKIDLPEDQQTINQVLDGQSDLSFDVTYEILPPVTLMDLKSIKLEKPVVEIDEADIDKEVQRVFAQQRGFEDKGDEGVVETGDRLGLSFKGTIDGKAFAGGSADHSHLTVGSGEFIPGFEEQLVGMKKGRPGPSRSPSPRTMRRKTCRARRPTSRLRSFTSTAPRPVNSMTSSPRRSVSRTSQASATPCASRWSPRLLR